MNRILYLALCWGLLGVQGGTCPAWSCGKLDKKDACMEVTESPSGVTYKLSPCPSSSQVCNIFDLSSTTKFCVDASSIKTLYPGEHCTKSSECLRGECDSKLSKCQASKLDGACASDIDCNPGLYCDGEKCQKLIELNQPCDDVKKCTVNAVCTKGECKRIGSLEENAETSNSAVCKTFYSYGGHCVKGPTLKKDGSSLVCPKSGKCTYQRGKDTEERPCECGFASGTNKFCRPGEGDLSMNDVS